jgi:glycosyltransferase involved in cell wall biosynthesis
MKVAIIHYAEPVSKDEGFVLTRYAALAKELIDCGNDVTRYFPVFNHRSRTFRTFDNYIDEFGSHKKVNTPGYNSSRGIKRIKFLSAFKKGVMESVSDTDYDVFVVGCPMPGISSALRKKYPRSKIITDLRDFWPDVQISSTKGIKRLIYSIAGTIFRKSTVSDLKSSDNIVTLSHSYADKIKRRCNLSYTPEVIPLGAVPIQNVIRKNKDLKLGKSGVIFVGSLNELFDFRRLLDIWEIFENSYPMLAAQNKLTIVGHGNQSDWVRKRAGELINVDVKGFIPQADAIDLMQESSVAIAIYRQMTYHTLPNKLFEFAASGLPIISNWAGDVLDETQQYDFAKGNESMSDIEFVSLLVELLVDENKCLNASNGALKFSRDYSRQNMAKRFRVLVCSS